MILSWAAWCMRMPAATETLKESTMPAMGMLHRISDAAIASSLTPLQQRRNSLVGCWTIQSTLTQHFVSNLSNMGTIQIPTIINKWRRLLIRLSTFYLWLQGVRGLFQLSLTFANVKAVKYEFRKRRYYYLCDGRDIQVLISKDDSCWYSPVHVMDRYLLKPIHNLNNYKLYISLSNISKTHI